MYMYAVFLLLLQVPDYSNILLKYFKIAVQFQQIFDAGFIEHLCVINKNLDTRNSIFVIFFLIKV